MSQLASDKRRPCYTNKSGYITSPHRSSHTCWGDIVLKVVVYEGVLMVNLISYLATESIIQSRNHLRTKFDLLCTWLIWYLEITEYRILSLVKNMMAASAEEERAQLTAIINYWNSVQPDLFAITLPDEVSLYWRVYLTRMYAVDASIM